MPFEDYETEHDAEFEGIEHDTLSIGSRKNGIGIEFATRDLGNQAAAIIGYDKIWDVIDHLIDLAGPRAFAAPSDHES